MSEKKQAAVILAAAIVIVVIGAVVSGHCWDLAVVGFTEQGYSRGHVQPDQPLTEFQISELRRLRWMAIVTTIVIMTVSLLLGFYLGRKSGQTTAGAVEAGHEDEKSSGSTRRFGILNWHDHFVSSGQAELSEEERVALEAERRYYLERLKNMAEEEEAELKNKTAGETAPPETALRKKANDE
jgi:hypothetical protein